MKEKTKNRLDELRQNNKDFREEITERISFQNNNISSVKSDIALYLVLFGIVITLVLFFAGYIVNGYLQETQKLKEEAKYLLSETKNIEKTVEKIKDEINNDTTALYKRLQKEEIDSIFEKLEKHPDDIGYYFFNLTRNVTLKNSRYYKRIKKMYPDTGEKSRDFYQALMFHISPETAILERSLFHKSDINTPNFGAKNLAGDNGLNIINVIFEKIPYEEIVKSENINFLVKILSDCNSYLEGCDYTSRLEVVEKSLSKEDLQSFKIFLSDRLPDTNGFIQSLRMQVVDK